MRIPFLFSGPFFAGLFLILFSFSSQAEVCTDSFSCREYALLQSPYCLDGQRDFLTFFYVSPSDFSSECSTCSGPDAEYYIECNSSSCPYGYSAEQETCWSSDCPYGDCPDPYGPDSTDYYDPDGGSTGTDPGPFPDPDGGDTGAGFSSADSQRLVNISNQVNSMASDLDSIDGIIEDVLWNINNNSDTLRGDLTVQTLKIETAISDLGEKISLGQSSQLSTLYGILLSLRGFVESYESNTGGDTGGGDTGGGGDGDYEMVLAQLLSSVKELREVNIANRCASTGEVYSPPEYLGETGDCVSPSAPLVYGSLDTDGLSGFSSAINESSIGKSVSTMTDLQITVSSECGGAFRYSLPTGDLPLVSRDMSIDLCVYLNPITPYLRIIALMFWSILGLRIILDA
ncbi:MAG: furin-like repeat-containing protein [Gammaproteobacteria bacterium]|jgi:hypothetical protein